MPTRRKFLGVLGSLPLWTLPLGLAQGQEKREKPEKADEPLPVSGPTGPEFLPLDELLTGFVTDHNAPGAAFALGRHGKILYARGFGMADREDHVAMAPDALFRIASISKPITAVAVLSLVEKGKLTLEAKILDLLGLGEPVDPRFKQVTVLELLHHTGGWDRDKSFDPMFRSVEISKDQGIEGPAMPANILHYMLKQKLDFDPGTRYAYSNFGYAILGLIVAKVSGVPYGEYVHQAVLNPLKMQHTRLGKTLPAGRAKDEVRYYDKPGRTGAAVMGKIGEQVPHPYGAWCLEAMDAHGGWLSTAPDLVRFAMAFDRPEECPVLSPRSIGVMFARPVGAVGQDDQGKPKDVWYSCGWSVRTAGRGVNTWHTGSLPGTSTILVRRQDGFDWAVLFNGRDGKDGKPLAAMIDGKVHGAVDAVKKNLG